MKKLIADTDKIMHKRKVMVFSTLTFILFSSLYTFNIQLSYGAYAKAPLSPNGPTVNDAKLTVEKVAEGLDFPTSMSFVGENDILVTEKNTGRVVRVLDGQVQEKPLLDLPVANSIERGLLGIAVSKHLNGKTFVFLSYTESGNGEDGSDTDSQIDPLGNRLYRYEYVNGQLINPLLLLDLTATPINARGEHNGGKILIGPDNNIYFMIGEVGGHRTQAQNILDGPSPNGLGGVLRITQDGGIVDPANPIFGKGLPLNIYYAMGIRNSFGMDFDPLTGNLWDTENGPTIADEINLIPPGFNGGWSQVQGYINQDLLGRGISSEDELVYFGNGKYNDPKFVWVTTIGPTALKFLNSDKLGKEYVNNMFTGDINNGLLYRFTLNEPRDNILINQSYQGDTKVLADNQVDDTRENQALIFGQGFGGITDLQVGPDGYLYVLSYTGTLYRVVPLIESDIPKNKQSVSEDEESQSKDSIPVIISGIKGSKSYSPDPVRIETGQTITWYNGDTVSHTVTSGQDNDPDEGSIFDSDAIIANEKYSITFDSPGDYKYYCIYHPSMIGEIIVE